ncbi:hypothetical protein [Leuconostoc citreum]
MNEFLTEEQANRLAQIMKQKTLSDIEVEAEILAEQLRARLQDYGIDYHTIYRAVFSAIEGDATRKANNHYKVLQSLIKRD